MGSVEVGLEPGTSQPLTGSLEGWESLESVKRASQGVQSGPFRFISIPSESQ